jgi:predicted PurR-regulated permease PerM
MPFFAAISVLVSLVLWGSIWGLQGAVLSVPLLAAMKVALVRTQARNLPRGA